MSLVVLGHQGGEASLPLAFASIAALAGYQAGWIAASTALLLFGLPLAWWAYRVPRVVDKERPATAANPRPRTRDWRRAEVLRDPAFWILLLGVLAPPFVGTTIFYHQDYFTELRGWPPGFYALSLSVAAGTTVSFALLCGALVDRFQAIAMLPYFLLPLGASCFVLALDGPRELLLLVMFLLGIAYGLSSTLFGALWPELYGTGHLGAIRSVTVSAGTLIDRGIAVPQQMNWIGAYCLLATVAMVAVSVHLRRRSAEGA